MHALGVGAAALACRGHTDERFGGLTLAIQSWTFRRFSIGDALGFIAELGVTRVELSPQASHFGHPATSEQIREMRTQIASYGLDCVTSGLEPVSADHEANRAVFEYAKELGLRTIMVDAPPESLDSLEQLCVEYDLRIGIHNHGHGTRYNTIADVEQALTGRDARIGTIIDTGHYTRSGIDPIAALHAFAGRVYGLHLKDVLGANPAAPDAILGEGVLELPGVFRAIRDIRIPSDASLSIEYEANETAPYEDVARGLENASRAARASL